MNAFLNFLIHNWYWILILIGLWWLGILPRFFKWLKQKASQQPTTGQPTPTVVQAPPAGLAAGFQAVGRIVGILLIILGIWGIWQPQLVYDVLNIVGINTGWGIDAARYRYIGRVDVNPQDATTNQNPGVRSQASADQSYWDAEAAEQKIRMLCNSPDSDWTAVGFDPDKDRQRFCSPGARTGEELKAFWNELTASNPITPTSTISPTITAERLQVWEEPVESAGGIPRAYYWVGIIIILTLCGAVLFGRIFR